VCYWLVDFPPLCELGLLEELVPELELLPELGLLEEPEELGLLDELAPELGLLEELEELGLLEELVPLEELAPELGLLEESEELGLVEELVPALGLLAEPEELGLLEELVPELGLLEELELEPLGGPEGFSPLCVVGLPSTPLASFLAASFDFADDFPEEDEPLESLVPCAVMELPDEVLPLSPVLPCPAVIFDESFPGSVLSCDCANNGPLTLPSAKADTAIK